MHDLFDEHAQCYTRPAQRQFASATGRGRGEEVPQFVVRHFADGVTYTASGWLDKNKGGMPSMLELTVKGSESTLMREMFGVKPLIDVTDPSSPNEGQKKAAQSIQAHARGRLARQRSKRLAEDGEEAPQRKKAASTVLGNFRASLKELFATLDITCARYVRCLKPNAAKAADLYLGRYVERQLGYNGVLAIVEIQAAGFAVSLPKREFAARYRCCAVTTADETKALASFFADPDADTESACRMLMMAAQRTLDGGKAVQTGEAWLDVGGACFGHTKVFVKEMVLRQLEKAREATAVSSVVHMQKVARAKLARRAVAAMRTLRPLVINVHRAAESGKEVVVTAEETVEALEALDEAMQLPGVCATLEAVAAVDQWAISRHAACAHLARRAEKDAEAAAALAAETAAREAARKAAADKVAAERKAAEAKAAAERAAADRAAAEAAVRAKAEAEVEAARKAVEEADEAEREKERAAAKAEADRKAAERKIAEEKAAAAQAEAEKARATTAAAKGKAAQPCDAYQVDTASATFGDCTCGWAKSAHSEAAQKAAPKAKKATMVAPTVNAREQAGCDNYRVDMTAARFGDCVCGHPKAAHSADATVHGTDHMPLSSADKPTDLRYRPRTGGRAARLAQQRNLVNEKLGADFFACDEYRVDVTAARFGDCKCGYPKAQHSLTSQRVGNEKGGVRQKKSMFNDRASIRASTGS